MFVLSLWYNSENWMSQCDLQVTPQRLAVRSVKEQVNPRVHHNTVLCLSVRPVHLTTHERQEN